MLRDRLNQALKEAMKSRENERLSTLRLINAAIKDRDIAARGDDGATGVSDDEILAILAKMSKQRVESARVYEEAGRLELAEQERAEIKVIEEFMPRQMDAEEVDVAIRAAIKKVGAESVRDMGKIMGELKSNYAGQMDFGKVGAKVKSALT
ncbi:GatB/YqeY domain-containing protein [Oceanomicrobium pacificus]|uniref:GatB/YqeY domain-containing protein n=1 Tax=Oceanomicrobium pacificus TaxID=2692916 RepID=A0A6B0TN57_9RHOB|nr:GatB/YqeY domain-containing protein [Oceanomicrobium pacificus]MXU65967.1 GatB/YqeY domain-containing protein [Oceanomicrobium pacificus]